MGSWTCKRRSLYTRIITSGIYGSGSYTDAAPSRIRISSGAKLPMNNLILNRWAAWTLLYTIRALKREKILRSCFLSHTSSPYQLQLDHHRPRTPRLSPPPRPSKHFHFNLSPTTPITMASSLRMAAPKMASMAAQSSVKVARSPMMKSQQLQKFSRAYSGETPITS